MHHSFFPTEQSEQTLNVFWIGSFFYGRKKKACSCLDCSHEKNKNISFMLTGEQCYFSSSNFKHSNHQTIKRRIKMLIFCTFKPSLAEREKWTKNPNSVLIVSSSIHVCQLLEAGAPIIDEVVVLVSSWAGGVEGADRTRVWAASFIVEHQERVVRRRGGVVIRSIQILPDKE